MDLSPTMISTMLECKICLETYHKPKQLNCGHTYCQDCLDGILIFKENGSAELVCPLRCTKKTIITKLETTSSLATTFCLTDILDKMSNCGKGIKLCQEAENCKQPICISCISCSAKMCEKCQRLHSCENKSYAVVTFDEKIQEVQPFCKKHSSLAKNVCIECEEKFTCVFCINREHKNHTKKTVEEMGLEIKKWFQSFVTSFEDRKVLLESLSGKYNEALMNLKSQRELFVHELEVRKLKRMEEYLQLLKAEEKKLLKDFDEKTEEFKAKVISGGYSENAKMKKFSSYIELLNSKSHFELVAEKKEIKKNISDLSSLPETFPNLNLHLPQINDNELLKNPLGELKITFYPAYIGDVSSSEWSACNNTIGETEGNFDYPQLTKDLMNLVKSLKGYEKSQGSTSLVNADTVKRDVNLKSAQPAVETCKFNEIVKIILDGDVEMLKSIISSDPNIAKMRDDDGETLLMIATRNTIDGTGFD
ncbi:E3 ubiquitin-protein ligase TRIM56-like [Hydractinia symbiolongicarpus]|uniref:E3 ubiquitin-protein ligase TRIM56-like n=1 Tax=Hydractinia symbiolongicarpus TaxID=13093 RepID=UPI002550F37C|nr:E3 ubiquitin-protein ligase TRIM56-like [Hydractinia symbiolongicarpus]